LNADNADDAVLFLVQNQKKRVIRVVCI